MLEEGIQSYLYKFRRVIVALHIKDTNKAKTIARALNSSYYHHGYAVGRKEAKDIGLTVTSPSLDLEKVLWEIWKDYCEK